VPGASSLPPLRKNDGKYGLLALLFLLGAGGLWFFMSGDEPEAPPEESQAPPEPPVREQFAAELEIPEDEPEAVEEPGAATSPEPPRKVGSPTSSEDWECNGSINAAKVAAIIKGGPSKQVQTCYERGLKSNNLLQGSMQVELTIGTSGSVKAVSVSGSLKDRQVYSCVKRVAKTWKFPPPTGGCVRIAAPFQMTPKL
jgi:TonB family protein